MDWVALLARAQAHGNLRMLRLGLLLAHSVVRSRGAARRRGLAGRPLGPGGADAPGRRSTGHPVPAKPDARPSPFLFHLGGCVSGRATGCAMR